MNIIINVHNLVNGPTWLFTKYTAMPPSVHCLGCGQNLDQVSYKRLLNTEASCHIIPLWTYISQEPHKGGRTCSGKGLVNVGGKMCRKCLSAYVRATKLLNILRESLAKAAEVLYESGSDSDSESCGILAPPSPKRAAICSESSSASPDVLANILVYCNSDIPSIINAGSHKLSKTST